MVWFIFVGRNRVSGVEHYKSVTENGFTVCDYQLVAAKKTKIKLHYHDQMDFLFYEKEGGKPELPESFAEHLPVIYVLARGYPPDVSIPLGEYPIDGADARVYIKGGRRMMDIGAESCEKAWELYEHLREIGERFHPRAA